MEAVVLSKNTLMPRRIAAFFVDQFIITLIVLAPAFIFFMPTNGTNDFFSIFPFVMTASTAGFLLKECVWRAKHRQALVWAVCA